MSRAMYMPHPVDSPFITVGVSCTAHRSHHFRQSGQAGFVVPGATRRKWAAATGPCCWGEYGQW